MDVCIIKVRRSLSVSHAFSSLASYSLWYTTSIILFIDLIIADALSGMESDDESSVSTIVQESVPDLRSIDESRHVAFFTGFCHLLAVAVLWEWIKKSEEVVKGTDERNAQNVVVAIWETEQPFWGGNGDDPGGRDSLLRFEYDWKIAF